MARQPPASPPQSPPVVTPAIPVAAVAAPLNHAGDPKLNQGHGWVHKRADGKKENCGGPEACQTCKQELEAAKQPFCPHVSVDPSDKDTVLGCSRPGRTGDGYLHNAGEKGKLYCNHQGEHVFERRIGSLKQLTARGKLRAGLDELDETMLSELGIPFFACGWCKKKTVYYVGVEKEHADCEAKKLGYYVEPTQMEPGAGLAGYLVVKTGPSEYAIVAHSPALPATKERPAQPAKYELRKDKQDWDDLQIHLTQLVGDDTMPVSVIAKAI